MSKISESRVEVCGTGIHLRRGGSGEPVLFLHGAGGIIGVPPFIERLADSFDFMAPDHPTFGKSDDADWLDNMGDLALFYLDFIESLNLKDVHIVGHSMGGWLALELAIRNEIPFKSITLVSAVGIRIKGQPAADIFITPPEELPALLFHNQAFIDAALQMAANATEEEEDLAIRNRIASARLGWQPRLFNPHLRKWLHRVKLPTHIVWGDSDKIIAPSYAAEFNSLIAGSKVTMIPQCGHVPNVEKADEFITHVSGFIAANAA